MKCLAIAVLAFACIGAANAAAHGSKDCALDTSKTGSIELGTATKILGKGAKLSVTYKIVPPGECSCCALASAFAQLAPRRDIVFLERKPASLHKILCARVPTFVGSEICSRRATLT